MGTDPQHARLKIACAAGCVAALAALYVIKVAPPFSSWPAEHTSMLTVHLLLELFAIVVAMQIVAISWHTFSAQKHTPAHALIAGFLVVANCDLVHAVTYDGMPEFLGHASTPRAIYFWLMGRSFEVLTLAALGFERLGWLSRNAAALLGLGVSAVVIWFGSYRLDLFPVTFVPGQGVTEFKARYEYVLSAANVLVGILLWRRAGRTGNPRTYLLATSCFLMAVGELAFTSYTRPSDAQNILGHLYKIAAYGLLYWATYIASLQAPFDALRESEAQVRENEMRLRSLSANLPDCVVYQMVVEPDGSRRYLQISDGVERIFGLRAADVLRDGSLLMRRVHPDDEALLDAARARAHGSMKLFDVVLRMRGADGGLRWIHLHAAPRHLPDGRLVWDGVQMDVTDRREAEDARRQLEGQLRDAQKLEAIGRLAGGIAHDFNNVLAAIVGNLALARDDLRRGALDAVGSGLDQIDKAARHAKGLVQQILTFSRREKPALQTMAPRPLLEDALDMVRATLPANVTLETRVTDFPDHVQADATQFQQILMNLCSNAWQAMPEARGHIEVGMEVLTFVAAEDRPREGLPGGRYVHVWVRDDGAGMDEITRRRIFEPFFTTKAMGRGTGLGLSVVHGIVQAHQGEIHVDSTPGQGSTFHIYLPAVPPAAATGDAVPERGRALPEALGRGEHVLYVDDDEVMALLVERLLERAGYRVSTFGDPLVALDAVREDPQRFDLVVSDYNMPQCTGIDLARHVAEVRPDVPVVLSSGHITDTLRRQADELGVRALVQKQHTLDQLVPAVARVLGEAVAAG